MGNKNNYIHPGRDYGTVCSDTDDSRGRGRCSSRGAGALPGGPEEEGSRRPRRRIPTTPLCIPADKDARSYQHYSSLWSQSTVSSRYPFTCPPANPGDRNRNQAPLEWGAVLFSGPNAVALAPCIRQRPVHSSLGRPVA